MPVAGFFKNPPPNTPISDPVSDPSLKLGQEVHDLHDPVARRNFRVVVIRPEEVERLDLSIPKRVRWTLVYRDGVRETPVSETGGETVYW